LSDPAYSDKLAIHRLGFCVALTRTHAESGFWEVEGRTDVIAIKAHTFKRTAEFLVARRRLRTGPVEPVVSLRRAQLFPDINADLSFDLKRVAFGSFVTRKIRIEPSSTMTCNLPLAAACF
jgi:hypothetical protein